ncbi:MAG: hypothetical protein V5A43_00025 [Haloarculaceae archaeon]
MNDRTHPLRRRTVLGAFAVGLAGCGEGATTTTEPGSSDGDGVTTTTDAGSSDGGGTPTAEDTGSANGGGTTTGADTGSSVGEASATTTETSLDLAEANVTGVEMASSGTGVRFDVTLYHDDDGEDGYANWWQVESPSGERLARRDLAHPHGTRPFTRSTTVDVRDGVNCVLVRGHDQTHGYGGQAMLVSIASGATRPFRQGSEATSAADESCP